MATRNVTSTIQVRRDTSANWESRNPILKAGEFGYDITNNLIKIGDGITDWKKLPDLSARKYTVYGVKIARNNSNPSTAVTYTDDAVGLTPATTNSAGSWADKYPFNQIRPCLLKDGKVLGYLNPNNYSQYENGAAATIDTFESGDVMVEFPKVFYNIYQDEGFTYVKISNNPASMVDGFTDWAFSYKGSVKDKFYIGAYQASTNNDKLYSVSGKQPAVNLTIGACRTAANVRGVGYEITPYNKLILLQALYLIRFKSLDSQSALGRGFVKALSVQHTGLTNLNGLYYGETSLTSRVKCHGLEDFWGNALEYIDGLVQYFYEILIADGNFNDSADGYTAAIRLDTTINGCMIDIQGSNNLGFLTSKGGGSESTYYSDSSYCERTSSLNFVLHGGAYNSERRAGIFSLDVGVNKYAYSVIYVARLCFCG